MKQFELWFMDGFFVRGSVHSLILDEIYLFVASQLQIKKELLRIVQLNPKLEVEYS